MREYVVSVIRVPGRSRPARWFCLFVRGSRTWMQPVRVLISEVGGRSVVTILPVDISDGHLAVATIIHDDLVRLPFNASGGVRLWLQLTNADVVEFSGRAVQIDVVGEARFVEDLPADLRPREAG